MPFNVKKQKSTRPYTRVNLTSPGSQTLTYTLAAFPPPHPRFIFVPLFPLFVPLPPLHSSNQGRPRLFEFWMPHTSFAHSISSFKFAPSPPPRVFQPFLIFLLFLPHPVLFTHHIGGQDNLMESWADGRQDSVWPGSRTL